MADIFSNVNVPCCMGDCSVCVCGTASNERALRGYLSDDNLPAMTKEQRKFCLDEIGRVEGYNADDYRGCNDKELANAVLCAWLDYARDKGLA